MDSTTTTSPLDRLMRLEEVMARTGLTRSMIYRWIAEDRFPRAVKPGGKGTITARWRESTIREWLAQLEEGQ